jgi:type I restriction enzyme R subunit
VHEDTKKYYFTLIDFRKATNHFADPDFDGEPVQVYKPGENDPPVPPDDETPKDENGDDLPIEPGGDETVVAGGDGAREPHVKYHVAGKRVAVLAERVEYLDEHGKLVTESLRDYSKRELKKRFASLHAFLTTATA